MGGFARAPYRGAPVIAARVTAPPRLRYTLAMASRDASVVELLLSLFNADGLRRHLRYGPEGANIERDLPGMNASPAVLADAAVEALRRRGLVDDAFFDGLLQEFPRRRVDIDRVRAAALRVAVVEPAVPPERALTPERAGPPQPAVQPSRPLGAVPSAPRRALRLFISYAHEDEPHRAVLDKSLSVLRNQGLISVWHDRQILAGAEWADAIDVELEAADIIVLLVSMDFLASPYCWGVEMKRAMERHDEGTARVIPVFVRDCDWSGAPFTRLQGVPDPEVPIDRAPNRDAAWTAVAKAIRAVAASLG